jgi:hypothetical protein
MDSAEAECRCAEGAELWDTDAKGYADERLEQTEVRADGWEVLYCCPDTGVKWLSGLPRGAEHGGGPMRLRRLGA